MRNKLAGKAFNRLMDNWHANTAENEACDRHFDGGEWSGPAWGKLHEAHEAKMLALVAARFGLTEDEVYQAAEELYYGEEEHRTRATTPWEPWTDCHGVRRHGQQCYEHWDRGLNCSCIPEDEQLRIKRALNRGDDPNTVIDTGWGQF